MGFVENFLGFTAV